MRNALLSSVSHDLKTPLAAIAGAAGSLIEDEVGPRRELVLTITEEADRLNRLISDLLDMTRLEAGALQVRKNGKLWRNCRCYTHASQRPTLRPPGYDSYS